MLEKTGKNLMSYASRLGNVVRKGLGNPSSSRSGFSDRNMGLIMDWATQNEIEANQLAVDSTRLLNSVGDRMERLRDQNFFQRCWNTFNGNNSGMERANINDLLNMQKTAIKYIGNLQKRSLISDNFMLSIRDELNALAIRELETRDLLDEQGEKLESLFGDVSELRSQMADVANMLSSLAARFTIMERKLSHVERSTRLHDWLILLEERHYERKCPSLFIRMMMVANEFYQLRNGIFNSDDILVLNRALRSVGINPDQAFSLYDLAELLIYDLHEHDMLFRSYPDQLNRNAPMRLPDYSRFAQKQVSYSVFSFMHYVNIYYPQALRNARALSRDMGTDETEILRDIIIKNAESGINFRTEWTWSAIAVQFLNGTLLARQLSEPRKRETDAKPKQALSLRGKEAVPLFKEVMSYLCGDSARLADERPLIANKLKAYKYEQFSIQEYGIPRTIIKIGEKLGLQLSRDNITAYAYDDGKYYIRAKRILAVYDEDSGRSGIIHDKRPPREDAKHADGSRLIKLEARGRHISKKQYIEIAKAKWEEMDLAGEIGHILKMEQKLVSKLNKEKKLNEKKAETREKIAETMQTCGVIAAVPFVLAGMLVKEGIQKMRKK